MNRVLAALSFSAVLGCGGRTGLIGGGDTGGRGSADAGVVSEVGAYCGWMGGPVASCEEASPTDPTMLCPTSYPFCRYQMHHCALPDADYGCWGCCDSNGGCFYYSSPSLRPVVPTEVCP
jgi:hypothetical protein